MLNSNIANLIRCLLGDLKSTFIWLLKGCPNPAPHWVKMRVLARHSQNKLWIESGTYRGDTTQWLAKRFQKVHTIEPSNRYFNFAKNRFRNFPNIVIYNELSEVILRKAILDIASRKSNLGISFWLDGHFSAADTFKGPEDSPVLKELALIADSRDMFSDCTIFIDDLRLFFGTDKSDITYPQIDSILEWAKQNKFSIKIENDIIILLSRKLTN